MTQPERFPSENLIWWLASASAMGIAITSCILAVYTSNPKELTAIILAIAIAIMACPKIRMKRGTRIVSVGALAVINVLSWVLVVWND